MYNMQLGNGLARISIWDGNASQSPRPKVATSLHFFLTPNARSKSIDE